MLIKKSIKRTLIAIAVLASRAYRIKLTWLFSNT